MIDASLLPALLTLLSVARSGSVGAAARLHHRTSSAISQQIRKLERHLGITLLERAGRGVRLTAAGEAALPGILKLGTETEALFAHLAELSGHPPATLRVAVSDYLGRALLVPVLRDLLEEQAPLRFEIATTHSREGVRLVGLGEVDCAVVTGHDVPRGLEAQRLFDQPFVWVGPRRAGGRASLTERLIREPLLRLGAGSQGRRLLEDYLTRERIQPVSTIDVPSVSLLLAYVSGAWAGDWRRPWRWPSWIAGGSGGSRRRSPPSRSPWCTGPASAARRLPAASRPASSRRASGPARAWLALP